MAYIAQSKSSMMQVTFTLMMLGVVDLHDFLGNVGFQSLESGQNSNIRLPVYASPMTNTRLQTRAKNCASLGWRVFLPHRRMGELYWKTMRTLRDTVLEMI